jgi:hypothetical protein
MLNVNLQEYQAVVSLKVHNEKKIKLKHSFDYDLGHCVTGISSVKALC